MISKIRNKESRRRFLRTMSELSNEERQVVYALVSRGTNEIDACQIVLWEKQLSAKDRRIA